MVDRKTNRLCVLLFYSLLFLDDEIDRTVDIKGFILLFNYWYENCNNK